MEYRKEIVDGTPTTFGKCQAIDHQGEREITQVSKKKGYYKCGECYFRYTPSTNLNVYKKRG